MKKILTALSLALLIPAALRASFEDVDAGARATSMGGAFVAQGDDVSAVFYNPAGLAGLPRYEVMASRESLFAGLTDGSALARSALAFGAPLTIKGAYWGSAALSWDTLDLNGLYNEGRIRLAYSRPVKDNIWVGFSIARLSVTYGSDAYTALNPVLAQTSQKSAMGVDVGVLARYGNLNVGLAILNANEPDLGLKYQNKVDRKIDLGLSLKKETFIWDLSVMSAGKDIRIKTGGEALLLRKMLKERFFARGGLSLGSRDYRNAAMGLGYRNGRYRVDYSFAYPLSGLADTMGSHQLGLTVAWGEAREGTEPDKDKTEEEEGGAAAAVVPRTDSDVTAKDRLEAGNLIASAKGKMEAGAYRAAYSALKRADWLLVTDQAVKDSLNKMATVANIVPALTAANAKAEVIRKSVNKYAAGNTDAVVFVTYAHQRWPADAYVTRFYEVIVKEFPVAASEMRLLPGMNIVEQLSQEALDAIRNNRFIYAITTLEKVLQLEPNNITALTRLGSAYWGMDKKDVAKRTWERVLRLDPENNEVKKFMKLN